jgi:asparagine synthase (glutamine-hydrolysing)
VTSRLIEPTGTAQQPSPWLASYGRRPPPAATRATLVGPVEHSRKLYLIAEPGSSPSVAERGGCSVVFSGRLHEPPDSRGTAPSGAGSDAVHVLSAYLRGGESALRNLRGMFALLLHDTSRECLFATRDPLGYHPLFFAEQEDRVLLSISQ